MKKPKTVMIIDDDERHLLTAKGLIEALGYIVEIHNSPFRTTEKVLKIKPDMVLLDVNMPALPGDRLCAILRSEPDLEDIPIYLYSANDEEILRKSVKQFQADGYICKGNVSALRLRVQQVLGD
ncbi:MAG: response regulator [Deltaproteobacteria bacterium]|nr:response regulator [Deltaproteobacteria bacterium]